MELLCAFLLDAAIGDPAWLPHPVIQMGHLINLLEKHLRRQNAAKTNQLVSGAVLVLLVLAATYGSSKLLLFTADWLHKYLGLLVNVVLLASTLAARGCRRRQRELSPLYVQVICRRHVMLSVWW